MAVFISDYTCVYTVLHKTLDQFLDQQNFFFPSTIHIILFLLLWPIYSLTGYFNQNTTYTEWKILTKCILAMQPWVYYGHVISPPLRKSWPRIRDVSTHIIFFPQSSVKLILEEKFYMKHSWLRGFMLPQTRLQMQKAMYWSEKILLYMYMYINFIHIVHFLMHNNLL